MKRKSWIYTIAIVLILCGGIALGGKYLLRRRALKWRDDAFAASHADPPNYAQAADLLARYLRRYGGDTRSLREYIRVRELAELPNAEHLTDTAAAIKLLMNAEHREDQQNHVDPVVTQLEDLQNQQHLVAIDMKLGRYPEAIDTATAALSNAASLPPARQSDPEVKKLKSQYLRFKVEALRRLRQDREALTVATDWLTIDPLDLEAQVICLDLRFGLHQPADEIVADTQKLAVPEPKKQKYSPEDPRFQLLVGAAYARRNAGEDGKIALNYLQKAAAHPYPGDAFTNALVAEFDKLDLPELAIAALDAAARSGSPEMRHVLGRRYWEVGKYSGAAEMLSDVDPKDPRSDPSLLALRAVSLNAIGQKNQAAQIREALARSRASAAIAWTAILHRELDSAAVTDKDLLKQCLDAVHLQPGDSYLSYFLGDCAARLGENEMAIDAWRRAVAVNPRWVAPSARLVDTLLQLGRSAEALQYARIAERTHTQPGTLAIARAIGSNAELVPATNVDQVLQGFQNLQHSLPEDEQTGLAHFKFLAATPGKAADAIGAARDLLTHNPPPDQRTFFALYAASGRYKLGLQQDILAAAEKAYGMTPSLAYLKALDLYISGKGDDAIKLLDGQVKSAKANDPSWKLVRARYLETTNQPSATDAWVDAGTPFPDNLAVQQAVVASRAAYRNHDFMKRTIENLKKLTSEPALDWRIADARLQTEFSQSEDEFNKGVTTLRKLVETDPAVPQIQVLMAHALLHIGDRSTAADHLTTAVQLNPTDIPTALELANQLQLLNKNIQAAGVLDRILPELSSADQRKKVAVMYARTGDAAKAIKTLESAGGDFDNSLFLATLYRQQGEYAKAEKIVQQRLSTTPDVQTIQFALPLYIARQKLDEARNILHILDELKLPAGNASMIRGRFAMRMRDLPGALHAFEKATQQSPQNADAWRMLAGCQIVSGSTADALKTVAAAAKAVPADRVFSTLQKQSALLERSASDPQLQPILVAAIREPAGVDTNLELLQILDDNRQAVDNDRLASRVQQLAERHPESLIAQMVLTDLNLQMGRDDEALSIAKRAMDAFPADPEPARVVVRVCTTIADTQRGTLASNAQDIAEACRKWKERAPDEAASADLELARLQLVMKQYDSALAQLAPYIDTAVKQPDSNPEILTGYAIAKANTGDPAAAANLLWPQVQKDPKWRLRWVQVAEQMTDLTPATQWLQRLNDSLATGDNADRIRIAETDDRLAARAAASQLQSQATQFSDQATRLYGEVVGDPKTDAVLLLAAAVRAERVKDLNLAESLYRKSLAANPSLIIAQNNLAWLLANRNKDLAEAQRLAQAAVNAQPRNPSFRDTLAKVQLTARNYSAAIEAEHAAIELNPENLLWRVREIQYLLDSGNRAEATNKLRQIDASALKVASAPDAIRRDLADLDKTLHVTRR